MRKLLVLFTALGLSACSVSTDSKTQMVQSYCLSAAAALEVATANINHIPKEQLIQIQTVNTTIVKPVCAQQQQPEWDTLVLGRIEQAVQIIAGASK